MYELLEETQTEITEGVAASADAIVLLVNSMPNYAGNSYDISMLGETMYNWVARACPSKPIMASYSEEDELLQTIKPLLKNGEYTVVLYSDTPLITASAVEQILDYVKVKDLSVCKLARGWVFKTEYLKNASAIYALNTYDVCALEQYQVNSAESLNKALNILQARINKYFMQNGVSIGNPQNTYIECNVSLEQGTVIEPFAKLTGNTVVGANSKIGSHCSIENSTIGENVIIKSGSQIIRSAVKENAIIANNCFITNKSLVAEEVIISANTTLNNATTMQGNTIGENCFIKNSKLASGVTIGDCCKLLGDTAQDVKVGSGATVGCASTLFAGVYIKSDCTLPEGTIARKE